MSNQPTDAEFNEYAAYTPPTNGGGFTKFENNKEIQVRIASDTVVFESIFKDKATGKETVSTKYAWVVWNYLTKQAEIMQLPVGGYKEVAKFGADVDYGDPKNYNLRITRTGEGFETKYAIIPSPNKSSLLEFAGEDAAEAVKNVNVIETLAKNENNQHVFWLKDLLRGTAKDTPMPQSQVVAADYPEADEDEDDKPIDLATIPF